MMVLPAKLNNVGAGNQMDGLPDYQSETRVNVTLTGVLPGYTYSGYTARNGVYGADYLTGTERLPF
jgi:hypothetical protein